MSYSHLDKHSEYRFMGSDRKEHEASELESLNSVQDPNEFYNECIDEIISFCKLHLDGIEKQTSEEVAEFLGVSERDVNKFQECMQSEMEWADKVRDPLVNPIYKRNGVEEIDFMIGFLEKLTDYLKKEGMDDIAENINVQKFYLSFRRKYLQGVAMKSDYEHSKSYMIAAIYSTIYREQKAMGMLNQNNLELNDIDFNQLTDDFDLEGFRRWYQGISRHNRVEYQYRDVAISQDVAKDYSLGHMSDNKSTMQDYWQSPTPFEPFRFDTLRFGNTFDNLRVGNTQDKSALFSEIDARLESYDIQKFDSRYWIAEYKVETVDGQAQGILRLQTKDGECNHRSASIKSLNSPDISEDRLESFHSRALTPDEIAEQNSLIERFNNKFPTIMQGRVSANDGYDAGSRFYVNGDTPSLDTNIRNNRGALESQHQDAGKSMWRGL